MAKRNNLQEGSVEVYFKYHVVCLVNKLIKIVKKLVEVRKFVVTVT
jgi:hypothetical protein